MCFHVCSQYSSAPLDLEADFCLDDAVTCQIADWIEQYVKLARRAPFSTIENSYHSNREFWQALPELALATNKIR